MRHEQQRDPGDPVPENWQNPEVRARLELEPIRRETRIELKADGSGTYVLEIQPAYMYKNYAHLMMSNNEKK